LGLKIFTELPSLDIKARNAGHVVRSRVAEWR